MWDLGVSSDLAAEKRRGLMWLWLSDILSRCWLKLSDELNKWGVFREERWQWQWIESRKIFFDGLLEEISWETPELFGEEVQVLLAIEQWIKKDKRCVGKIRDSGFQESQERILLKVFLKKSVKKRLSYLEMGFNSYVLAIEWWFKKKQEVCWQNWRVWWWRESRKKIISVLIEENGWEMAELFRVEA
jgi:hypothetical protein